LIEASVRRAFQQALGDAVAFDVPMTRHTSLRIGGPADVLVTPGDAPEVSTVLGLCRRHALPHLAIGAGFNCLASDAGIEGVVIKLNRMRGIEVRPDDSLRAQAGVTHASLTKLCVDRGLSGLEFGAGIPGVVGGWILMNAGIGSREVKDVVREIEIVLPDGSAQTIPRKKLDFHYRALRGLTAGAVVVAAVFEVSVLEGGAATEVVRREVGRLLALRAGTQPLNVPSCGSVFKNPEGDFAGRLIEAAGLKGKSEGGAQISPVHANFIANIGGATAADVHRLMELAREAVEKETGIRLEPEVRMIGRSEGDA
jgi:UDP-N-acetylmuramate dehydrogenase